MSGKNIPVIDPSDPLSAEGEGPVPSVRPGRLRRFTFLLLGFIDEVEQRAPGYFRHNRLTLLLDSEPESGLIGTEYLATVAGLRGVELAYVREEERLNAVDRLFALQAQAPDFNFEDELAHGVDEKSLARTLVDDYDRHREEHARRVDEAMATLDRGRVEVQGDCALSYYVGGKGERTLVIVNAYGHGLGYWTKLLAGLMEGHRVVVWLPRGHEHGTIGVNRFEPVGVHADDLNRLLIHLNVEKCDLLGWCTGPKLLLEFYARHPEKVSTMVFLNGAFKGPDGRKNLETEYEISLEPLFKLVNETPHVAPLLADSLKAVLLKQKASAGSGPAGDGRITEVLSSVNAGLRDLVVQPFCDERSVVNYARQLLDFWGHDIAPLLPRVQAPVLLIGGECDRIASPQMSETVAGLIPLAKHLEVRGGSHYLHYERHELMTAIIGDFIKRPRDFDFDHELLK